MKADDFKNPDGETYNGLKLVAAMSGLSDAEIMWTLSRLKELRANGTPRHLQNDIIKTEAISKLWEIKP
jgi:hypothetical protein